MREFNDIMWATGLFEGEGWSCLHAEGRKRKDGTRHFVPKLGLGNTDKDVIDKFREIVKVGSVYCRKAQGPNRKPIWIWEINCNKAITLAKTFFPFLSMRRQAQFVKVFGEALNEAV